MLKDEHGNMAGIVLELENGMLKPEKLADSMLAISSDQDLYQKLYSRIASSSRKFYVESVAEKYLKVYQTVLLK